MNSRVFYNAINRFCNILCGLHGERVKNESAFYGLLLSFYRAGTHIEHMHARVAADADADLARLHETVTKEIADLRRYKLVRGDKEVETYADRIAHRGALLKEIDAMRGCVARIEELFTGFCEFFETLRGNDYFVKLGKCGTRIELARLFYRETVRRAKNRFGVGKGLVRSDAYSICLILALLGARPGPRFGLVFIDEGQDISVNEYRLLRLLNPDAAFNIYGDLAQNITRYRGLTDWSKVNAGDYYTLEQNYRNTNQIVDYVARELGISMQPIGFDGPEVARIGVRGISAFFRDKKGLKAVIVPESEIERYRRKSYNVLGETGRISKKKVNLMTVYESKGLEFTCVAVADKNMTKQEKYIAYTRALKELAIVGEGNGAD